MKIIIGLGNPGKKFEKNRHNVGFLILDRIKNAYHFPEFSFDEKFNAEISELTSKLTNNKKIILVKPQTFMNNSGSSIISMINYYKETVTNDDIIVIHDDIDLPIGKFKITDDSSSAGHNGVQDIMNKLKTQRIKRIRVGVANDKIRKFIDPGEFVLQNPSPEETKKMELSDDDIANLINDVSGHILFEVKK